MAKRQSSSKQRSQGGGRTANSEPRQQVFRDFAGCNFMLSPRTFSLAEADQEQGDLQMNFVVVQNNICSTENRTFETRNNMVKLFEAPEGRTFTDACILIGDEFHIGLDDGTLMYGTLGSGTLDGTVTLNNNTGSDHHWRSFAYVDDKLVGTTQEDQLWTGTIGTHSLQNARRVPNPAAPTMSNIAPKGKLRVSTTATDECSFRVAIAWSHINRYGPTRCSNQFTFYANYPVDEWHAGCYAVISGTVPDGYDITAVEIYFNTGNASTLQFCGRTDLGGSLSWTFSWFGYLDVTSMWPVANLIAPTDNYTEGVKASHVTCIDSRLYFWGSADEPQRLWIGGNPGNLFSISPGTGGGFVDVEPGTSQQIRVVTKYKTQSGNSIVTMLCDSPNSSMEQRFNLVENSVTISNEQSMKSWQAEQVAGSVGCKSFHGAIVCEDGLYSISRYGLALTTLTMEYNSQIRTNYVSDPIKPVFTDKDGYLLANAVILHCDGVIYVGFGTGDSAIDDMLFCYDINAKAWWTLTLDLDEPIINMVHIDHEGNREGIGIITRDNVYLLPLTHDDQADLNADFPVVLQTGGLSTQQPQQGWFHLSQLIFMFDHIIGDLDIELVGIDQFGRKVTTSKHISHEQVAYDVPEFMRVDLKLRNYRLRITGQARFRLTHWIARLYTMSNKQGIVWGFDDMQTYRGSGDIHPTFQDYNDIKQAVIP